MLSILAKPTIIRAIMASFCLHASGIGVAVAIQAWFVDSQSPTFAGRTAVVELHWSPVSESRSKLSIDLPETQAAAEAPDRQAITPNSFPMEIASRKPTVENAAKRMPSPADVATETVNPPPVDRASEPDVDHSPPVAKSPPRKHAVHRPSSLAAVVPPPGAAADTPPDFSNNRRPAYPSAAYRRGIEGEVLLRLFVAASGEVRRVEIARSSGFEILDRAAVEAVSTWRGRPAQRRGVAVSSVQQLPVRFQLRS